MRSSLASPIYIAAMLLLVSLGWLADFRGAMAQTPALASPASKSATNEEDVTGALLAAATANLTLGELALQRSTNADVRHWAEGLVSESTILVKQTLETSKDLGISPAQNLVSTSLTGRADGVMRDALAASPAEFDRRYVLGCAGYQQALLEMLDGLLIPNVEKPALESLLATVRSATEIRLEDGLRVASRLGG
jgi:predicted outer membrane protein